MDYQVSARKYRPGTFEGVIGQPHVVTTLMNAIASRRVPHAFLLSGGRGVGKTTVARILAKALNCEQGPTSTPCDRCATCVEILQGSSVDVIEIDGASNTSVDDIREVRENVKFTPFRGHYRVYIIDEVHMLSNSAFNALLKTLEEPPAHVVFIFATTELHKIPATILSRCQHYTFRRIARSEIIQRLRHVAGQDAITVEDRSLASIARASDGSMRDALSLMDQAVSFGGKTIRHEDLDALLGAVPHELVRDMLAAVRTRNPAAAVEVISRLADQGHDLRSFCAEVVEHVRNVLVAAVVPELEGLRGLVDGSDDEVALLLEDGRSFRQDELQELFRLFCQTEDALRLSAHPRFVLEVAAIRATTSRAAAADASPLPASCESHAAGGTAVKEQPDAKAAAVPRSYPGPAETRPSTTSPTHPGRPETRPLTTSPTHPGRAETRPLTTSPALPGRAETRPLTTSPTHPGRAETRPLPGAASGTSAVPPPASEEGKESLATANASVRSPSAPKPTGPQHAKKTAAASRDQSIEAEGQDAAPAAQAPGPDAAAGKLGWDEVVDRIEQRYPNIAPFLAMAGSMKLEGGHVVIGFPRTASVALARIQKPEVLESIAAVCRELAAREVTVSALELGEDVQNGPTLAERRAAKERDQQVMLLEQTRSHPFVKQALAMFGADVVEVRPTVSQKETR
jgi:DNA polymerase-3 subunit gamma/tau